VIVERGVAGADALRRSLEVEHDFVERQLVGEHHARGREILEGLLHAAFFGAELQNGPTESSAV